MFIIDEIAYKSAFRHHSPLGKLLFCISALVASLLTKSIIVPAIVLAIFIVLIHSSTKFFLPKLLLAAYAGTVFLLLFSAAIFAFFQAGESIWSASFLGLQLNLTREGANLSALLAIRALAGFAVLFFFSSSTPLPHLFLALRQAGIPPYLAELTVLVYRYSFMLLEQLGQMYTAANCRLGFRTYSQSMRTFGKLLSNLFGRSMDFAERAQSALLCRNYNGGFPTLRSPAPLSLWHAALSLAILAVLYLIGASTASFVIF